jgi:type II secretory ATPase GspE/PulE/Tfp pilus assembly ATPase PilB-like protein
VLLTSGGGSLEQAPLGCLSHLPPAGWSGPDPRSCQVLATLFDEIFQPVEKVRAADDLGEDLPIIRLVDFIINEAIEARASHIYFVPHLKWTQVLHRVDEELLEAITPSKFSQRGLTQRFKLLAHMDLSLEQVFQKGEFGWDYKGQSYSLEVTTSPTDSGESLAIAITLGERR